MNRNCSVDVFRYICAILVVAIHTRPLEELNPTLGFLAADVIPRIGVPFFFAVSGYFYLAKLEKGEKPFKTQMKKVLGLYSTWSLFYYLIDFLQWGHRDLKGFSINCIVFYFWYGSAYHFWFFPALIYAMGIATLLWKLRMKPLIFPLSMALYLVGVLGCAYYNVCQSVPILGPFFACSQFDAIRRILLMGFPFFAGGYLILRIKERIGRRKALLWWMASFVLWLFEIVLVVRLHYQRSVVLSFALYPFVISTLIVLLKNPMPELKSISGTCRKLANFTYYAHPAFIMVLSLLLHYPNSNTALFLSTVLTTLAVGLLVCKTKKPMVNKLIG